MKLIETRTLGMLLKAKSFGTFKNQNDEYCRVSTWYDRNTKKIQVVFCKDGEIASRFAILSTSEKKIVNLLINEGFELCEN